LLRPPPSDVRARPCVLAHEAAKEPYVLSVLERVPRLHLRAGSLGRLDHDRSLPHPGHRYVAPRERVARGWRIRPELGYDGAAVHDLLSKLAVLGWVDTPDARAEDRDRPTARIEARLVRGRVDSDREPREHRHVVCRKQAR